MIKVNKINGSPETIPNTSYGLHSDDEFFYFFESDIERKDFLAALPKIFDKRSWEESVVEPAVLNHIRATIRPLPLDYIGLNDVALHLNHEEYGEESKSIQLWYCACMDSITSQIELITEPIEVQTIIDNLPPLLISN